MVTSLKSSEVKEAIEIEDYVKYKIELIGLWYFYHLSMFHL